MARRGTPSSEEIRQEAEQVPKETQRQGYFRILSCPPVSLRSKGGWGENRQHKDSDACFVQFQAGLKRARRALPNAECYPAPYQQLISL